MHDFPRYRKPAEVADDFDLIRGKCEKIGDQLTGLAGLFGAASALTLGVGIWNHEPLFAVGSGFALAAAGGFAVSAHAALQASLTARRARRAQALAPVVRLRRAA